MAPNIKYTEYKSFQWFWFNPTEMGNKSGFSLNVKTNTNFERVARISPINHKVKCNQYNPKINFWYSIDNFPIQNWSFSQYLLMDQCLSLSASLRLWSSRRYSSDHKTQTLKSNQNVLKVIRHGIFLRKWRPSNHCWVDKALNFARSWMAHYISAYSVATTATSKKSHKLKKPTVITFFAEPQTGYRPS